jgi:bifunctional DNA-binding transcriptional regulator/antitoxin component of YhaV-PrlF toxin-antitoxin module
VIPKHLRDQLGIAPGDEVESALEGAAIRVELVHGAADQLGEQIRDVCLDCSFPYEEMGG